MSFLRNLQVTPTTEQERCCLCLHVRFATILLGCFLIAANASSIIFIPLTQVGLQTQNSSMTYVPPPVNPQPETLGDGAEKMSTTSEHSDEDQQQYVMASSRVEPLKHFLQIAVATMLVYGAHSYKSMYLMPFMCIRFFNLLQTVLGIANLFSHTVREYEREPELIISDQNGERVESNDQTSEMQDIDSMASLSASRYGLLATVLFFFLYLNILIYTLSIVWRCYKFILRRNRENMRRVNNLANAAGSAAFWGPDGSVNPPVSGNWLTELDRDDQNGDDASNPGTGGASTAPFKLPNYSEVAKDPQGKKFMIVNMTSTAGNSGNTVNDEACPGYSGLAPDCPGYDAPPLAEPGVPSAETVIEGTENMDGPPPSYEQASERCQQDVQVDVPDLADGDESEVQVFNGTLQVQDPEAENKNSAA